MIFRFAKLILNIKINYSQHFLLFKPEIHSTFHCDIKIELEFFFSMFICDDSSVFPFLILSALVDSQNDIVPRPIRKKFIPWLNVEIFESLQLKWKCWSWIIFIIVLNISHYHNVWFQMHSEMNLPWTIRQLEQDHLRLEKQHSHRFLNLQIYYDSDATSIGKNKNSIIMRKE